LAKTVIKSTAQGPITDLENLVKGKFRDKPRSSGNQRLERADSLFHRRGLDTPGVMRVWPFTHMELEFAILNVPGVGFEI
jgi:hypothetical protein